MQLSNPSPLSFNPSFSPTVNAATTIFFGGSGIIPTGSGAYYEIENPGLSTIGFYINPPNNNDWVQYFGTFDNINYSEVTFRQLGSDGYSQEATGVEHYIGSIAGLRKIRFVNATGSATSGCVMGTLSKEVCVIEGIEHNAPPHKFGNALFHRGINYSGSSLSNSGIFMPSSRHKFAVTYISLGIYSDGGAYVTFHEGSGTAGNPDKWVFSTYVRAKIDNSQLLNANLSTPYVSDYETGLYLSVDGAATFRGVIHGYQTEN